MSFTKEKNKSCYTCRKRRRELISESVVLLAVVVTDRVDDFPFPLPLPFSLGGISSTMTQSEAEELVNFSRLFVSVKDDRLRE
jgi:hypothetical protein